MKQVKRLIAFMLLVCMLLSLPLPVAYAAGESNDNSGNGGVGVSGNGDSGSVINNDNSGGGNVLLGEPAINEEPTVYDFFYAGAASKKADIFGSKYGKGKLDPLYAEGSINWTPLVETAGDNKGKSSAFSDTGIGGINASSIVGEWLAIKIKSPGTGTYNVILNHFNLSAAATEAGVYILPLSVGESKEAIEAAVADGTYKVGSVDFKNGKGQIILGAKDFVGGEEYIVVFKALADRYKNTEIVLKDGAVNPATMTPNSLVMVKKAYQEGVYNFVQDAYSGKAVDDQLASGKTVYQELGERYSNFALNWKIENMSTAGKVTFSGSGLAVDSDVGDWIAYRINLPSAGTYRFKLDHTLSADGAETVNVYLVKAAADMTPGDIETEMTPDNLLKTVTFNGKGAASVDIGIGTNLKKQEYVLVFQVGQGSDTGAKMHLGKISIIPINMAMYDFDLADTVTGSSTYRNKTIAQTKEKLDELYKTGKLNWAYLDGVNTREDYAADAMTGLDFRTAYGLRMKTGTDSWYAFTIKSPGAGKYTLSLDHAIYSYGAQQGYVYVIEKPAEGTDMKALVNKLVVDEDPLAVVKFSGSQLEDGLNTNLGTYDFKADKEYVVVYYALSSNTDTGSGTGYMMVSHLIAIEGEIESEGAKNINHLNLGAKLVDVNMRGRVATTTIDGEDYYYLPLQGGQLLVYNLDTMELVTRVSTGVMNAWSIDAAEDGTCYIAGDCRYIYEYNVKTGVKKKHYYSNSYVVGYDLKVAENGNVYFGIKGEGYGSGCVIKFDTTTHEFTYYKDLDKEGLATEAPGAAYHDGYIFCTLYGKYTDETGKTRAQTKLLKINEATGEIVGEVNLYDYTHPIDIELYSSSRKISAVAVAGDILLLGGDYMNNDLCFDTETLEFIDLGFPMGFVGQMSEVIDGKCYGMVFHGSLVEIDIESRTGSYVAGMSAATTSIRARHCVVSVNHPDLPGDSIMTMNKADGSPVFYNLQTKKIVTYTDFTKGEGSSMDLQSVLASNDGSGMVFVGGYTTENAVAYDVFNDEWAYSFKTLGQTDSMFMYEGELYAGCYATCSLGRVDYKNGAVEELLCIGTSTDYEQKRIHRLIGVDGKMIFSTVPDTGNLGGALAIFDIESYDSVVHPDFVHNQIVMDMFYHDGLLFGCTSVSGGSSSKPQEEVSKLFVYDMKNNVKLGEFVIDIEGLSKEDVPFISSLGIDENGKMWGVVAECLFSFTYDRKTNTMEFTEELSFSKTNFKTNGGRDWCYIPMIFHEGYLYFSFTSQRLTKVNIENPSDYERLAAISPGDYCIAEDGNLYYTSGSKLMMIPLKYSDSDFAVAEKVNAQILALDSKVTTANMHKVKAVLDAYDNLTDEQKCMVQDYSRLGTLQRRYVTTLIASLPAELSLEDEALVVEARENYNELPSAVRRFVTNLADLEAAEDTIRNLKYLVKSEERAALVSKLIDNIPAEITLAAAGKINLARTNYDQLTNYQKTLVLNYQKLLDAEAALAVLVQAQDQIYADKVIAQIDALGTITLRSEKAIRTARLAYESLSDAQKALVTNYQKLVDAEAELARLKVEGDENVKAVEAVEALIELIGDVITLDSKDTIAAAREAYNALTDFQKTLVNNYDHLTQAEALLAELEAEQKQMIITVVTIVIVAVVLVAGTATLFVIPATRAKILGMFKKKSKSEAE